MHFNGIMLKWNKPVTKSQVPFDSKYTRYIGQPIPETDRRTVLPEATERDLGE